MNNYKKRKQRTPKRSTSQNSDFKSKDIKDSSCNRQDCGKGSNDAEWYMRNKQLAGDVANLYFSQQLGLPIDLGDVGSKDIVFTNESQVMPGICRISWIPSIGTSSACTYAAQNIYSYIVHANSRNYKYDAPDLMMYLLAMDNIYIWISQLERVYGVLNVYSANNRYLPNALVKALGFDPDDLIPKVVELRAHINTLVSKASIFWVPNVFSLLQRHWWMSTNIYADSDSRQPQLYVYRPSYVYKWSGTASEQGSCLLPVNISSSYLTMADIRNISNELLNPLLSDQDIGIMGGDILKAFGSDKLFSLLPIEENYTVVPVYNEEVLMQIHNLMFEMFEPSNITQGPTGLISQDFVKTTKESRYMARNTKQIFDFKGKVPSVEDILVASRMAPAIRTTLLEGNYVTGAAYTTEIPISMHIFTLNDAGGYSSVYFNSSYYECKDPVAMAKLMSVFSKFDWAPLIYLYTIDSSSGVITEYGVMGDIDVYTTLSNTEKFRISDAALPSLYGTPLA